MSDRATNTGAGDLSLEERLIMLIRQRGPITIADYMADALAHPHEGYYMSGEAIGSNGDFTTAPEISQIFGEMIGLWLVQSWIDIGSPESFNLIELGPGRGVLMSDILRAAQLRPNFIRAAHIWMIETSGRLRHEQQKRLKIYTDATINWEDRLSDIPPKPTLLIANEFFDCLPIRQYQKQRTGWHERMVGLSPDEGNLEYVMAPAPTLLDHPMGGLQQGNDGDILEIGVPASTQCSDIANIMISNKGRALIIDYGHYSSDYGDTFQAVRNHQFWPPLESPGKADLTAHVDFQQLSNAALHEGASVYGAISQGHFLDRLGVHYRIEALCQNKSDEEQEIIRQGAMRLISAAQMGELFKVLCISSTELPPPAGFEQN